MKISCEWSQADWDKALKKVWELSRNFEDILNFGLEHNFITSSDIIHASDIYKDPNKEWDDEEVKEIIQSRGLKDIMEIIQNEYSLDDIIDELPTDDILDTIDDDKRLDSLTGSWTLDTHDSEVREEYHNEIIHDLIIEQEEKEKERENNRLLWYPDDWHKFICDTLGCSYFDTEGLKYKLEIFKEELNKNSYNVKYD